MKAIDFKKSEGAASPLRVLLLEESLSDSQNILEELRAAGMAIEPIVVGNRGEFIDAIMSQEFGIVLSAHRLADWDGLGALGELQKTGKVAPFLIVNGEMGRQDASECLRMGVSDCVPKSQLARLPIAVKRALEAQKLREANDEARRTLEKSEARNRELVESSVYGIFRIALGGSFLSANRALREILACDSLESLQTMNFCRDIFRYPEHCGKAMAQCRKEGLVPSTETEWRRKDGGLVAIKLHLRRLSVPGGADQIEGIAEDTTELRSLEHQLLQAQKFETIGQLAGGLGHDFNNVVGAILGWAELGYEESVAFPKIAERFTRIREQADRAASLTRELLAGTGMGLATAYGIAKQHGGFIHVYSEPWQGSLFRVYLPAVEGMLAPQAKMEAAEPSRCASLDGTETILFAEDHDSVREMVRQWLVNLGYRVVCAANGEEALRLCEQEIPALAVVDVVMPRMGGTATAAELRRHLANLPVLFTSGYSEATRVSALQLPNSYYLQKPYSPTSLARVIRKSFDGDGQAS